MASKERRSYNSRRRDRSASRSRSTSSEEDHRRRRRKERKEDRAEEERATIATECHRRRSASPARDRRDRRPRDRSTSRDRRDRRHSPAIKARGPLQSQMASFERSQGTTGAVETGKEPAEKQRPNYQPSGLLAAASNSVAQADGTQIVLKYHEPGEARKPGPREDWKLFVFKGADVVETIALGARSCWLVGREAAVVDLLAEHPSISKQHAALQFRCVEKTDEYGETRARVKPYLIDLDSANATLLNGEPLAPRRYVELRPQDLLQFGHSTREYVLMLSRTD